MNDIFISYQSKDRRMAREVVAALKRKGWSVWWDQSLLPGVRFGKVIRKRIEQAGCVVVLWSQAAIDSDWVNSEAGMALEADKLITALLEDLTPDPPFNVLQNALLVDSDGILQESGIQLLIEAIDAKISKNISSETPPCQVSNDIVSPGPSPQPYSHFMSRSIMIGIIFIVAIGTLPLWLPPANTMVAALINKTREILSVAPQEPDRSEIDRLLAEAYQNLSSDRLIEPSEDNAYSQYRRVLNLVPSNEDAQDGIRGVKERLVEMADQEFNRGNFEKALNNLERGLQIAPELEGIESARQRLKRLLRTAGTAFRDELMKSNLQGPEMLIIPAGEFMMGSPDDEMDHEADEGPRHRKRITQSFAIGRHEVTFEEYEQFTRAKKKRIPENEGWGKENRPVINVTWEDAVAYTEWLSEQTGKRYRLPTEAEWEFAARAGTQTPYWWGNKTEFKRANCDGCNKEPAEKTEQVGSYGQSGANAWKLRDTAGNVWEWVQDCWHVDYQNASQDGSAWEQPAEGDCRLRVLRGGSWQTQPSALRSANRHKLLSKAPRIDVGFRVVREL